MNVYADYTDACPKCLSKDLSRTDYGTGGFEYWEKYRCTECGHVFTDVYRYHHSYDEEGEDGQG